MRHSFFLLLPAFLWNSCTFDTSGLKGGSQSANCGNGIREDGEICDGTDIGTASCADLGFAEGTLACSPTCDAWDTRNCTGSVLPDCGNGIREDGETCDGTDIGTASCADLGFYSGTPTCSADCQSIESAGCFGFCGDGILQETRETCDGTDIGTASCADLGFYSGTPACSADCQSIESAGCFGFCGDGILQGTRETCDGTDIGTASCADLGCRGNQAPFCSANCQSLDPAGCFAGHDEDADAVDDNCDNCPTWNGAQANTDGDGVGNLCESSLYDFSQIASFEAFVAGAPGFSNYGGTWDTTKADRVEGTGPNSGIAGNFLQNTQLTPPFAVETVFIYPDNGPNSAKYAGVAVGASLGTNGNITALYACVFERDAKKVQIWKYEGNYTKVAESGAVNTNAANGDWRRVRAVAAPNADGLSTLTCEYYDKKGKSASASYTPPSSTSTDAAFAGLAGLRLYNDKAHFLAWVRYE